MGWSWTSKLKSSKGRGIQVGSGPFLSALDLGVPIALLTRHRHERGQQCCTRMDLKSTSFWTKASFV